MRESKGLYEFDVAISFAGTERDYARAIAEIARENGLSVFIDEWHKAKLWGEPLTETLPEIYESKARFCIILVSSTYCKRIYTNVERKAALDRAIQSPEAYILPVRVDNSWLKGLPKATAALDLRRHSVIEIVRLTIEKLRGEAPASIRIPENVHISRLPMLTLESGELASHLIDLCRQSMAAGVKAFGCLIYDESTAEYRKLLLDQDYRDALDIASGDDLEVFCVRDEEEIETEFEYSSELMTIASMGRPRSRSYYYSQLLRKYFGVERKRLVYPSFLLFLVAENKVTHCRLIPLSRGGVHDTFLRLQKMFKIVSECLSVSDVSSPEIWEKLKSRLLDEKFTLYIRQSPVEVDAAIKGLVEYYEPEVGSEFSGGEAE